MKCQWFCYLIFKGLIRLAKNGLKDLQEPKATNWYVRLNQLTGQLWIKLHWRFPVFSSRNFWLIYFLGTKVSNPYVAMVVILAYTANVLSIEYTDVYLYSKVKNKHWLFLHVFVCNGQQLFSRYFYFASNMKPTENVPSNLKKFFCCFNKLFKYWQWDFILILTDICL